MYRTWDEIRAALQAACETQYRDFSCKLMPDTPPDFVLGVRVPFLRKAAQMCDSEATGSLLRVLTHKYHEEYLVHVFLIHRVRDFSLATEYVDTILPYISNWAICDSLSPAVFKNNTDKLLPHIEKWLSSQHNFTVRFGVLQLMRHFLTPESIKLANDSVCAVKSDDYYVNMARAWYFATALAAEYDATLPYLQNNALDVWTHNKTIQKAIESYRVSAPQKAYLRTLRRKS